MFAAGEYIFSWLEKAGERLCGTSPAGTGQGGNRSVEMVARGTGMGTGVLVWGASKDLNGGDSARRFPLIIPPSSLQSGPARLFFFLRHRHTHRQRL